jgi:hypothetical protein
MRRRENGLFERRNASAFSCAGDWLCLARFRAGVGPVPAPKPCQDGSIQALWITALMVIRKQAVLVGIATTDVWRRFLPLRGH